MSQQWPTEFEVDAALKHKDASIRRVRYWYVRINHKLGMPLPRAAFIGWLPKRLEKKFCGLSCWFEFPDGTKAVMILLNRKTEFNPNIWMATLTHEIAHLLNPNEDCGTVKHEDAVIALRRKVLDIRKWRML